MRMTLRERFPEAIEAEDYLLLAAVFLLPWAFGGIEMWAFRPAAFLVAAAAAVSIAKHGAAGIGIHRDNRWLLPALLLGVWAAVQLLPLPPSAIRAISPSADRVYRKAFPGYPGDVAGDIVPILERQALALVPEATSIPPPTGPAESFAPPPAGRWSGWRTLSLEPDATSERFFWYVALLLAFLVTIRRTSEPEVARVYRLTLYCVFGALAAFGLLQALTWNGMLLWVREFQGDARPFGPYVNPNHFAGVMELAVPCFAGLAWSEVRRNRGKSWGGTTTPLVVGATFLCLVAGVSAGSRMATALMGISVTVLGLAGIRRARVRRFVVVGLLVGWAAAIAIVLQTPLGDRFRTLLSGAEGGVAGNSRLLAWKASLPMLKDSPLTGTGFGTFRFVFPAYLPAGETSSWRQVHNDYLEVLIEGGLVAGVLLAWLVAAYVARAVATYRSPGRPAFRPRVLGVFLGLASLAVHAFVDFNHQMPANALLFVTLAGIALARPPALERGEPT